MLRVRLLGGVSLEVGDRAPAELSPAAAALLGWLALHEGRHERDAVARRLWPELEPAAAETALAVALDDLGAVLPDRSPLTQPAGALELAGDDALWVDVRAFAAAADGGDLEAAAAVSRGELMPGLEGDWVEAAREAHRARLLDVLERLAAEAEQSGDLQTAARLTAEQTALEPLSEQCHRALIARLDAAGDRAGAIAAYERLRERLRSDLRVKPSAETRALVEQLGR